MARTGVYGIQSIKFADTPSDGSFPTEWKGFEMKAIVKDSFSFNDTTPSETNIEVEDMDENYATLESDKGSSGFTVQTYDMSEEAYKYFWGYAEGSGANQGWLVETPGWELGNKAVQITTRKFGDFPAKIFEWASMRIAVTRTGTIGKSGFPNLNLSFTKQAFTDSEGKEVAGARWKVVTE